MLPGLVGFFQMFQQIPFHQPVDIPVTGNSANLVPDINKCADEFELVLYQFGEYKFNLFIKLGNLNRVRTFQFVTAHHIAIVRNQRLKKPTTINDIEYWLRVT